jgi:hypothetical protein
MSIPPVTNLSPEQSSWDGLRIPSSARAARQWVKSPTGSDSTSGEQFLSISVKVNKHAAIVPDSFHAILSQKYKKLFCIFGTDVAEVNNGDNGRRARSFGCDVYKCTM